jgi:hypothetical protein
MSPEFLTISGVYCTRIRLVYRFPAKIELVFFFLNLVKLPFQRFTVGMVL